MQRRLFLAAILCGANAAGRAVAQARGVSAFAVPRDYAIDGYFGRETAPARLHRTQTAIRYEARGGGVPHTVVARLDRNGVRSRPTVRASASARAPLAARGSASSSSRAKPFRASRCRSCA
jgi:hypothetical protein